MFLFNWSLGRFTAETTSCAPTPGDQTQGPGPRSIELI